MATWKSFDKNWKEVSSWQAIITSAFYASCVRSITADEAYYLAKNHPHTIETDEPMYHPELMGMPFDAKVLVINDGGIVGRYAKARRVVDDFTPEEKSKYETILREAIYQMTQKPCIKSLAVVGLDPQFMVRAHFITPEKYAVDVFNWLSNFTPYQRVAQAYADSRSLEGFEIRILSDPDWKDSDNDKPLVIIDPKHQSAAILGLRYFGEKKKATLTLAWSLGVELGMVACHAGIKRMKLKNTSRELEEKSVAFFGLSGSGKSSLTNNISHDGHLKTEDGEEVVIIHDDAFIVDLDNNRSMALEPTLFDKTDGTEPGSEDIKYWISAQNQMVAPIGRKLRIIPSDIRNKNGRAIKHRDWLKNLADACSAPDYVCWLMKDELLPPIVYLDDAAMAVAMGACLSTKRTAAENVSLEEMKKLIIEPFANPFRVYPLAKDCKRFISLFQSGCKGYILNTGEFLGHDVPKKLTLEIVVRLLRGEIEFQKWLPGMRIVVPGTLDDKYTPPDDGGYYEKMRTHFIQRLEFLKKEKALEEVIEAIRKVETYLISL